MKKRDSRVISINLGKKEEDIKSWIIALKSKNLEYSFFVKQIMLSFLSKNTVFLGKVHLRNHSQNMRISIYASDEKTLALFKTLESNNIKISSFIKSLIRKNIKIIPGYEDEVLPDYIDFLDDLGDIKISETSDKEKSSQAKEQIKEKIVNKTPVKNKKISTLAMNYTSFGD